MNCTAIGGWKKSSLSFANSNCVEIAWHISTASANGSCIEVGWQKSSASYANGQCLEAGSGEGEGACGLIHVRDSKLGDASPVLDFTPAEWSAFLAGVRNGEFDAI